MTEPTQQLKGGWPVTGAAQQLEGGWPVTGPAQQLEGGHGGRDLGVAVLLVTDQVTGGTLAGLARDAPLVVLGVASLPCRRPPPPHPG